MANDLEILEIGARSNIKVDLQDDVYEMEKLGEFRSRNSIKKVDT